MKNKLKPGPNPGPEGPLVRFGASVRPSALKMLRRLAREENVSIGRQIEMLLGWFWCQTDKGGKL